MKKTLPLMSFFVCLSFISLGQYAQENVFKSWSFRKKDKNGGQIVYRRKGDSNQPSAHYDPN